MESCLRQNRLPLEILIGDDSTEAGGEDVVNSIAASSQVPIRYHRNEQRLGQSGNVNSLIARVAGTHLTLLHDDDLFLDNGIDTLLAELESHPEATCLYGLQKIVDASGELLDDVTARWNLRDRRLPSFSGAQTRPLRAALWCQPPNDAFIVRADDAKRIRLSGEHLVGHAVDAHFMIKLACAAKSGSFVLVPHPVSKYRLTPNSIARSKTINGREDLFYSWLLSEPRLEDEREARDELLRRISAAAALDAAQAGLKRDALRIILSPHYKLPWLSRWTWFRIVSVASPSAGNVVKGFIDSRKDTRS